MNNQKICPFTGLPVPSDLAGFQWIRAGMIEQGDLLVSHKDRHYEWYGGDVNEWTIDTINTLGWDVYRKMECAKHLDHADCACHPDEPVKAKTFDDGKPPLAFLPWKGLREVAMVQAYGHKKYGDFYNYKDGMEVGRHCSCAVRHIADYMDGKDFDEESKRNHLAHAVCRLLFVLENLAEGTAIDDRYKPDSK